MKVISTQIHLSTGVLLTNLIFWHIQSLILHLQYNISANLCIVTPHIKAFNSLIPWDILIILLDRVFSYKLLITLLTTFNDSNWVSCSTSRTSVTSYILLLGNSPIYINWKSNRHGTISKSFSEAEYRAIAHVASELTWMVMLLNELGVLNLTPVILHYEFYDNQSAIYIAKNLVFMKGPNTLN